MKFFGYELDEQMRCYIKDNEGDVPTSVMRYWLKLCHSCIDVTSPVKGDPFHLWLTDDSLSDAFEIADEIDAEFAKLKQEREQLRDLLCELWNSCPVWEDDCLKCEHCTGDGGVLDCELYSQMREFGIDFDDVRDGVYERV